MQNDVDIIPEQPFEEGVAAGRKMTGPELERRTRQALSDPLLCGDLGAMAGVQLTQWVMSRLETEPDYTEYPELQDVYPERLDRLRGLAQGAACSLETAAKFDCVLYLHEIREWTAAMNPLPRSGNCSGVLMLGPEGIIVGQSQESAPLTPRPSHYRYRPPAPYAGLRQEPTQRAPAVVKRPRTGYVENWGTTNECGVGLIGAGSCGTWLDEPIEDVWPIKRFPLLRFARNVGELLALYDRYKLFNWGRSSEITADLSGDAAVIEHSFRRIGVRPLAGAHALWATEGNFEQDDMAAFIRARRREYGRQQGLHLGADDFQYEADCGVRFTHLGELAHRPWGRGMDHMRRLLTDHSPFPRNICRHGGPDTDSYDVSVTQCSTIFDLTHNRTHVRQWQPWEHFPCEVAEQVTQYPPRPCDG